MCRQNREAVDENTAGTLQAHLLQLEARKKRGILYLCGFAGDECRARVQM